MLSEELEPITGVWGRFPGGGSGGKKPPEADRLLAFECPTEAADLSYFLSVCKLTVQSTVVQTFSISSRNTPGAPSRPK